MTLVPSIKATYYEVEKTKIMMQMMIHVHKEIGNRIKVDEIERKWETLPTPATKDI